MRRLRLQHRTIFGRPHLFASLSFSPLPTILRLRFCFDFVEPYPDGRVHNPFTCDLLIVFLSRWGYRQMTPGGK